MKRIAFKPALFAVLLGLALSWASPAFAHVEEPRLEINIDRINPGGVVDLRGVGFDYEENVTLSLISSQPEIAIGEVVASVEGDFIYIVSLPVDVVEGTYHFRAVTSHHYVLSPPITVWGTAIQGEGGHGHGDREEEDPLLAPMPTFAPGVIPGGVVPTKVEAVPASTPASKQNWMMLAMGMGALIVVGVSILLSLRRKIQS